jgi:hypothetical protein
MIHRTLQVLSRYVATVTRAAALVEMPQIGPQVHRRYPQAPAVDHDQPLLGRGAFLLVAGASARRYHRLPPPQGIRDARSAAFRELMLIMRVSRDPVTHSKLGRNSLKTIHPNPCARQSQFQMTLAVVLALLVSPTIIATAGTDVIPARPTSELAEPARVPFEAEATAGSHGDPVGSFLYGNFGKAQDVLQEAIEAHGGPDWVNGHVGYSIAYQGQYLFQAHLNKPWAHLDHGLEGRILYAPTGPTLKSDVTLTLHRPIPQGCLLQADFGLSLDSGVQDPEELRDEALATRWREERELLPQEFLRQALENPGSLCFLGTHGSRDVLQYEAGNAGRRALFLDSSTHLLQRVESFAHWDSKGDRLEWIEFSAYQPFDDIQIPMTVRSHRELETTQANQFVALTNVVLGTASESDAATLPVELRERYPDFPRPRASFPGDAATALLPIHDLGQGVHLLDLEAVEGRSVLVEFADYIVVVESGGTSQVAEQILASAGHYFPDKPVRYLAMSHHHRISASGIRPYVQRGITLLATKGNVDYLRDLAARPYRLVPDAQQRSPMLPRIELVEGLKVIEDAQQRLELHEFGTSTHTDEYVFLYLPKLQLGTVGDLLYMPENPDQQPAAPRGVALYQLIGDLKLDIRHLVQTWPLEPNYAWIPIETLERQVQLAIERDHNGK